ncbi:MAG: hypothetical protein HY822_24095 [Acidobacteria bacterium]|nr:hypothetical protein [Acidobacteriota bacterium]
MGAARRKRTQGGLEMIEFALCSLFLLPIFLGTFVAGMNLIRANQCVHATRDVGNLYMKGVDFSLSPNKDLAVRLANGLGMQNSPSSGKGVLILSQVTFIGDTTCTANGLTSGTCTNRNQYVFTQRIVIGNTTLRTSSVGTPTATLNSAGMVQNYLTDPGARAASSFAFLWNPQLADGQYVFITEGFFTGIYLGSASSNGGIFTRVFL